MLLFPRSNSLEYWHFLISVIFSENLVMTLNFGEYFKYCKTNSVADAKAPTTHHITHVM